MFKGREESEMIREKQPYFQGRGLGRCGETAQMVGTRYCDRWGYEDGSDYGKKPHNLRDNLGVDF